MTTVGGQGMNTGIQDAANLGWKLAAVARGAPEHLLDSYDAERGAVGAALLATTSRGLTAATLASPPLEIVRDTVASWLGELRFVQDRVRGFISETAVQYRRSPIVRDYGDASTLRAGDRAPDAALGAQEGQPLRLFEYFAAPVHTLLAVDLSDAQAAALAEAWPAAQLVRAASTTNAGLARQYGAGGSPLVYAIRHDGYIGFRGTPADDVALSDYPHELGAQASDDNR